MKKKILALMLAGACAFSFVACGEADVDKKVADSEAHVTVDNAASAETAEEIAAIYAKYSENPFAYVPSELVKLGNYENLEIELDESKYEFKQADLDTLIQNFIDQYVGAVKDESQIEVKADSVVNIDYEGKLDGVAFQGGTATDQKIDVKNDATRYISGFTEGLIGAKVGDTIDVPLTFPANYQATDLAGKETVFTMKINYIYGKVTLDNLTDAMCAEKIGVADKKEFLSKSKEIYELQLKNNRQSDLSSAVLDKLMAEAKITEVPTALLAAMNEGYLATYQGYADEYGMTLEELLSQFLSTDAATFAENANEQNTSALRQEMVLRAIAEAMKLTIDEAELEEFIANTMAATGVTSREEFVKKYNTNQDANDGYTNIRYSFLNRKALESVIDKAKVVSK